MLNKHVFFGVLCLFAFCLQSTLGAVLAIDYGTDWIKASLMKPGVPFDVLLNKDSKRKIQSTVGWKNDDRLFGSDAYNVAARFPSDSFSSLKYLQAATYTSDVLSFFSTISTADVVETSRKTVALKRSDGSQWALEELIAMQFAYVKELAENLAGEKVYDVIVTVPPFYTQFERDAVVDAVEIAGLRTLALINDGTAVAVNYAMTRTFPTPEYHIIYDAGASSIRATVVSFTTVSTNDSKSKSATPSTHVSVAAVGFDRKVGGTELDRRLRNILVEDFWRKNRQDIRQNKRAMAKFWKEAQRVKHILSANSETTTTIESVVSDIDYRSKIKRSTFEAECSELKGRFTLPIFTSLAKAGLTLDNITSVILTGGSSRTPMIQNAVRSLVGENKVAVNVNADEAAVLGAALHGASLSRQFKTKDIKVSDVCPYDIQVSYPTEPKENVKPRTIQTLVFPAGSKTGSKKSLTFKRRDDFTIQLGYKKIPTPGFPLELLEADITGVAEAIANLTEKGVVDPVVKATVVLSESGFASIHDAIVVGEAKADSFTDKIKGLFGGGSSSQETSSTESSESTPSTESSTTAIPEASPSPSAAKPPKEESLPLTVNIRFPTLAPMTVAEKRASRDRLRELDNLESSKRRKEEARNNLEGYLYRLRDLLDDPSETPFRKCSKPQERSTITTKLEETMTWMHDMADDAETVQFLEKLSGLESLEKPIVHRYKEIEEFPHALNNSQKWNWSTRLFITEARTNLTADESDSGSDNYNPVSKYTKEEIDSLEKTLREHEAWLGEWVAKQKTVAMNEDPVILTSEMKARAKTLENHLQRLVKRKVSPKKKTKSATTTTTTTATTDPAGSSSSPSSSGESVTETDIPVSEPLVGGEYSAQSPLEDHGHDEL